MYIDCVPLYRANRRARRSTCAAGITWTLNVMYNSYIMRRTQIYLTEEQGRVLESRSRATGRTVSDLIRDAIEAAYSHRRAMSRAERIGLARRTAGAWTEFAETGAKYVERIRGARRLARLHTR